MDNQSLKNQLKQLQSIMDERISDITDAEGNKNVAFKDGIINIDKYVDIHPKILWILKEANSTEEGLNWREELSDLKKL